MSLLAWWKEILIGLLVLAIGVQTARLNISKAEFKSYEAEIQKQVAEGKAAIALERARINANNAQALDDLQTRYVALNARYKRLRDGSSPAGSPDLSQSLGIAQACPGEPSQPNPLVGRMAEVEREIEAALEFGDKEISKYVELWKLQEKNAER
jgi:hypothetical protein